MGNKARFFTIGTAAIAGVIGASLGRMAFADPTASPSGSAAPSPSASASAAAPATKLKGSDIPTATSDMPVMKQFSDEWTAGRQVLPTEDHSGTCTFTVVREWLRIRCIERLGASMIAGDPTDVKIYSAGSNLWEAHGRIATIVMRLRKGDNRMFYLINFDEGYDSASLTEAEKIAVYWREDADDPVILMSYF
ncbi:MAG: hypothetical protein IPK82_37035 [Polyangiaceae bacterium]|nr:hypothetical protein [Polyangiaceae bacterium]